MHALAVNSERPQRELGPFGCSPTKVKQHTFYRNTNKHLPKMERNTMVINGLTMLFIAPVVCVVLYWLSKWA